jgi:hypothetical protein
MDQEKWFFHLEPDGAVMLQRGAYGDDGTIGDAIEVIRPGESALDLSYRQLAAARAGTIVIEGERARIPRGRWPLATPKAGGFRLVRCATDELLNRCEPAVRKVGRARRRCRGRAHLEGARRAGGLAVVLDAALRLPPRPQTDPRLRGDA